MTEETTPKDKVVVSTAGSGIMRPPFNLRLSRKTMMVAAIVIIVGIAGGVIWYVHKPTAPKVDYFDPAYNLAVTEGKYDQGQQMLTDAINKAANKQDAADLYLQKATIALNAKHPDDAIQFAKKADGLAPSSMTASMIAGAAAAQGNKTLAIQWLNTTIQRLDKKSQGYQMDLQDTQQQIKDLSQ